MTASASELGSRRRVGQPSVRCHAQARAVLAGLLLLSLLIQPGLAASPPVLIALSESQANPPPPLPADAQAIEFRSKEPALVSAGEHFLVQLGPARYAEFAITGLTTYVNGDTAVQAEGQVDGSDYSLSLTVGQTSLFGYVNSPHDSYQIYAVAEEGGHRGWLFTPGSLSAGQHPRHDYWLPEDLAALVPELDQAPVSLPLRAGGQGEGGAPPAQVPASESVGAGLRLHQTLHPTPVVIGEPLAGQIEVVNISGKTLGNQVLEVYFLLENTDLVGASAGCSESLSLSLQRVLRCELGAFAAGESKTVSYRVNTSPASAPTVFSTALVGDLRLDDTVNVVQDVLTDSDADGVSDFNEQIMATDPFDPGSVDLGFSVIDVMALYTPGSETLYPFGVATRINQLISVANQIYADSGVKIVLRPVYHGRVDLPDGVDLDRTLTQLLEGAHPSLAGVGALRSAYGADLVMLLRPLGSEVARCGLAPVGGYATGGDFTNPAERALAYSVIGIDCPDDVVVAHELGHNMGLTHSRREDGRGGTFDFATGFGVDGEFATVMARPAAFGTDTRVGQFASPAYDCLGYVCGAEAGSEQGADAVLTLNTVRQQIAAFSAQRVPYLPALLLEALSGRPTRAHISVVASPDDGLGFTDRIRPGERVDVFAEITPDPEHLGQLASVHVLMRSRDNSLFQLDRDGRIVAWDGSVESLLAAVPEAPLRVYQQLSILDDFVFTEGARDEVVEFYVAYTLTGFSEVIYTAQPLRLQVSQD